MSKPTEDELKEALSHFEDLSPAQALRDTLEGLDAIAEHEEDAEKLAASIRTALGAYSLKLRKRVEIPTEYGPYVFHLDQHEERFPVLERIENEMRDRVKWAGADDGYDVDRAIEARGGL